MGMYSGIGSFAKTTPQNPRRFFNGGFVLPTFTLEQYTTFYNNSPELQEMYSSAEEAYNAYLSVSGGSNQGSGNVVIGTPGNAPTNTTNTNTQSLPSYMSFDDNGNVVFADGITNRQFVEALNMLGLLGGDHPEGTDYDWLIQWFTDDNEGGQSDWLNVHLSDPNRQLDFDRMHGGSGLTDANKTTLRRLYEIVNNASTAGGFFVPSQGFKNTYSSPTVPGQNYGGGDGTTASRPVFIGQPATGGTPEQPYYSTSDVLVTSQEQPDLYDVVDLYPEGGFEVYNPYETQIDLPYAYQPPDGTPPITVTTNPTDPIDPVVNPPGVNTGGGNNTGGGTNNGGTNNGGNNNNNGSNPCPEGYVLSNGVCVVDTSQPPPEPPPPPPPPPPQAGDYINFADAQGLDDYLYGQRDVGYRGDIQAMVGSREDLTAEDFNALLAQQAGAFGEGSTLAYDPRFGVYSTISDDQLAQYQAGEMGGVYSDLNPNLISDEDRIRQNMLGSGTDTIRYTDDAGRFFYINKDRQRLRIGDKQYIMNPDGTVTSYTVRDTPRQGPTFIGQPGTGFAEGGIVSVAGNMTDQEITGEGIESFLNPERSKATLRRNLAKLAPRPTAPAPTMQQGIMPMAR